MYLDDVPIDAIAKELGTSPANVRVKASRLGVRRPPVSPEGRSRATRKPPRPDDIATRLAMLLGQEPRPVAPRREIPDEDLLRYAGERTPPEATEPLWERVRPHILRHPLPAHDGASLAKLHGFLAFAHEMIGVEPQDYQAAMAYLMLAHRSSVFVMGRQVGKDYVAGLFVAWESIVRPNSRILVVSEAQRQSDMLAERTMAFLARSAEAFDSVAESNRERMRFTNGSEVYFLPSTGAIRGLTEVTRAIVNEARGVPDESYEAITPMLARLNGSLCVFSTPMGMQGKLFEFYSNPTFAAMQLPSSVNRFLDAAFLEAEKLKMDADAYSREYLAQFSDVQGAFFSSQSIERARRDYDLSEAREEGKTYSIGFDPARVRDSSVITVVSKEQDGHLRVEAIRDFVNVPFQDQLAVIRWLAQIFRPSTVVVEYAGLGIGPAEELEQTNLPVERFKPTVESKLEAYGHLKNILEKGHLTIPASHSKLAVELRMFQFKVTDSGNVTLHHISGQGDDFADSLCYAVWPFKEDVYRPGDMTRTLEITSRLFSGRW